MFIAQPYRLNDVKKNGMERPLICKTMSVHKSRLFVFIFTMKVDSSLSLQVTVISFISPPLPSDSKKDICFSVTGSVTGGAKVLNSGHPKIVRG
jgi:hypothetical protein